MLDGTDFSVKQCLGSLFKLDFIDMGDHRTE
jgi:hypothetical protein